MRIVIFAAMAALLVAALAVPGAFDDDALAFALAYAIVRIAHIGLFLIASRDEPELRRSVVGLAVGTTIGVGAARWPLRRRTERCRRASGPSRSSLDLGLPFLFWAEGWQLVPAHFAERHGLILIIALGESIVAIGIGSNAVVDVGVVVAATLGIAIAAALWWVYFDVTVWVAERRLSRRLRDASRTRSRVTRYSYLHLRDGRGDRAARARDEEDARARRTTRSKTVPAAALVGGVATYLLAIVAFRWRLLHTLSRPRLIAAAALLALLPLAVEVPAYATVATVVVVVWALIVYEVVRYADFRQNVRQELAREGAAK